MHTLFVSFRMFSSNSKEKYTYCLFNTHTLTLLACGHVERIASVPELQVQQIGAVQSDLRSFATACLGFVSLTKAVYEAVSPTMRGA